MQLDVVIGKPSMQMRDAGEAIDLRLRHRWSRVARNGHVMRIPPGSLEEGVEVGREQTRSAFVVARGP